MAIFLFLLVLASLLKGGLALDVDMVDRRLSELTAQLKQVTSEMLETKYELIETKSDLTKTNTELTKTKSELKELKTSLGGVSTQLQTIQSDAQKANVSFHTRLHDDLNCSSGHVLQFSKVYTNIGKGYNPSSGVFTAPVSGTYVFLFIVASLSTSQYANAVLMLDGKIITYAHAAKPNPGSEMSSSHTVLHLNKGQRLWVQCNGGNSYFYWGGTRFSGFLLRLDP